MKIEKLMDLVFSEVVCTKHEVEWSKLNKEQRIHEIHEEMGCCKDFESEYLDDKLVSLVKRLSYEIE